MIQPTRLRLSRAKGFDLQAQSLAANGLPATNVARPSRWGNPFIVGQDGTRRECVDLYVKLTCQGLLCLSRPENLPAQEATLATFRKSRADLRGHNLACWCPLPKHGEVDYCHAAVLLEVANA